VKKTFVSLVTVFISYFFLSVPAVLAVFTFTADPATVTPDQEIQVTVNLTLQNQNNTIYYLEGALKPEGGSNYFSQTWNDSAWTAYTASSNYTSLKQITTDDSGNWTGTLRVKVDTESSYFTGNGNYIL